MPAEHLAREHLAREHLARQALRHRDTRLFLLNGFFVNAASAMQATAIGVLVYDRTNSKLNLGLIGLAEFLPSAILVLVTGPIADRFDRRRILACALVGEAIIALFLAQAARSATTSLLPFVGLAVGFGIARAFAAPAGRAITPSIPPPDLVPTVMALSSADWQLAVVVGPVVGGFLYRGSPSWVFTTCTVLFIVGALLALRVHPRPIPPTPDDERPSLSKALDGLRFIRRTPILLGAIALDLVAVLFGGATALLPVFAKDILHVDAAGLGLLRAAGGIGAGATALWLATRPLARHVGRSLFIAVGVFGAATVGFGLSRSFRLSLILLLVAGAADMVSVFVRSTLVPAVTPDDRRGRVFAVEQVFIGASNELGAFESGVAAAALGAPAAVVLGGLVTVATVVLWPRLFPAMVRIDRFSDATAAATGMTETGAG